MGIVQGTGIANGSFFALKVSGFIPDLSHEFRIIRDLNKKENIRQTGLIPQVLYSGRFFAGEKALPVLCHGRALRRKTLQFTALFAGAGDGLAFLPIKFLFA